MRGGAISYCISTTDRRRRGKSRLDLRRFAAIAAGIAFLAVAVPATPAAPATTGIALGAYVDSHPQPHAPYASIAALESSIGHSLAIFQTFEDWQLPGGVAQPFPTQFATYVASIGATPMITWQPQMTPGNGVSTTAQPDFSLVQLASGRYDAFIRSWADGAKAFGKVVYVRLMHEFNGAWYPWGNGVNGNTPAEYVTAWRHIVTVVDGEGTTNIRFVWCASSGSHVDPTPFFPGDAYTSWIALDAYNHRADWRSFTTVFSAHYAQITAISARPVMVAETASLENPLDPMAKPAWITSAFLTEIPQNFPRVAAALYFDSKGRTSSQSLTSSATSVQAFAQVAASPEYQAPAPG